ncbi:MAG: gluconate 2-dehydrogenase subunit 3 family protein [Parcubacteria group bacterium]|jgi:hypothetical protein
MGKRLDKNYNSLDRLEKWDEGTQAEIKKRLQDEVGLDLQYKFLNEQEGHMLELLVDVLVPQEKNEQYIKISEAIDRQLASGEKGVRYGTDPWPQEFYQQGLAEVGKESEKFFGKTIEKLNGEELTAMLESLMARDPDDFLHRFMGRILADAVKIYYSHPKAWSEIGFPGPAFPSGYAHLECDKAHDWEPKYL